MISQTPAFFPLPTAGMGNGAAVPMTMGDGTAPQPAIPFANVLTQAQVLANAQTQAGMNPLVLALLNGLAGMPTVADAMPIIPREGEAAPETPTTTETATPGQETTPENANITLLAMAGLCLNPIQTSAATLTIAPQIPVQSSDAAVQSVPTASGIVEQTTLQGSPQETASLVALMQTGQVKNETGAIPKEGKQPIEADAAPLPAEPTAQPQKQSEEAKPHPLLVPTMPAQLLEAQAKIGANIKAGQGQQTETDVSVLPQNALQHAQSEANTERNTMAAASAEAFPIAQGMPKKISALPMDTERATALPMLTLPTSASRLSPEADTSKEESEENSERALLIGRAHSQEKPIDLHSAEAFGETLHRVENAGQASATQTEPVKPQTTDRYEVAAQVTKHLEAMTAMGGRSELVLQLKPEHLGQVKITLSTSETGLSAKITMDSAQAHQAMTGARETLRSAFEQRGITLETLDVSLNQQAFGNGQQAFAGMQMGQSHSQMFGTRHHSAGQTAFAAEDDENIPTVITGQNRPSNLNRLDFRA